MISKLKEWRPEVSTDSAIEMIYYKINTKGIKGKTIKALISSLSSEEKQERQKYY
jgi:hypothetical protein